MTNIEGSEIKISNSQGESAAIEAYIKPYREHINADLSAVLAYAPQTLDKSGEWQTTIGNLFADVVLSKGNPIFQKRENKSIDICLLNNGGIRSVINKGNVTARTAYEIMPFENALAVTALKGDQIIEMTEYIISERKPHPLAGMRFEIGKDNKATNIIINGQPLQNDKIYYVGTSDYLANGGDNMVFFKKNVGRFDLEYKLRNMLIDYFKETDTLPVITDIRISRQQ
ncbi:MAG TPA: 5'-nucleotidase [Flavobacterium sp.]|nr:5'-nucleotidase [Flavobacterium sp.]